MRLTTKMFSISALSSVRVIDLSRILAGPYCTMQLGDLGAEVIKVEAPVNGDETRRWGPPYLGSESCYYLSVNRNKKSLTLNLKTEEGRKILHELARVSDVLVENFLPGKLDLIGLGYEDVKRYNPTIIYCSLTGFGATGPYSKRAGYDIIAASIGGFLDITGPEYGEPCKAGTAVTDLMTGLQMQGAILAALFNKQRTGKGQRIEANLLASQVSALINIGSTYLNGGVCQSRTGTAHHSIVPYETFGTADGYMTIGATSDGQFVGLCKAIGVSDLVDDPLYRTNCDRVANRSTLVPRIKSQMLLHTNCEWEAIFSEQSVTFAYGSVNSISQVFNDPQVRHMNLVHELKSSDGKHKIRQISHPVSYDGAQAPIRLPPPRLGEHTNTILRDLLGYDDARIEKLRKHGVI